MTRHRCPICDREDAGERLIRDGDQRDLCWGQGLHDCLTHAVNWRDRALVAEGKVARCEAALAAIEKRSISASDAAAQTWNRAVGLSANVLRAALATTQPNKEQGR